jgi:hypothetical protein
MMRAWPAALAATVATGAGLSIGAAADRWAPAPAADVLKGTEEAFSEGLQWRELPPRQAPLRWTEPSARVTFRHLPPGPATLELDLRHHGAPVTVTANGARMAELLPGEHGGRYDVGRLVSPTLEVALQTAGRSDPAGRRLGTQLYRVALRHAPPRRPAASLLMLFALTGFAGSALALAAGVGPPSAALAGSGLAGLLAAGLLPHGLIRSAYAAELAALLVAVSVLACVLALLAERASAGAGRWAFGAVLAAALVQGVAAVSPVMVTSDAYFHANNLIRVSKGSWFLTSITPHAQPFRIPYGVSFYALLLPLFPTGVEPVRLVRWGAALSGVAASIALFFLLSRRSARLAGVAVVLLQLLPASFRYFSEGTLSNVFGQSLTALFFAWWAGGAPLGAGLGAALLGVGCLAHLSSLIALLLLGAALLLLRRREGRLGNARAWALAAGFGLALLYYAAFFRLIVDQLPRLLEGAGEGGGAPQGLLGALAEQLRDAVGGWGLPAMALAWIGRPRRLADPLERDLAAFWLTGAVLCGVALLSPLEARYVYALTPAVGAAAAHGLLRLWDAGGLRRVAAAALFAVQAGLAVREIVDAVLFRYRP